MRGFAAYLVVGVLVALVLELFAPAAGIGLTVNAWSIVPPGDKLQYVDRTHKGDRLNISVTTVDKQQMRRAPAKMLVGCDPVFSPLSAAASANFPGRCTA